MEKTIQGELNRLQQSLKAPKGQYNSFSKFYYRSCEDILEAVKPLLDKCTLVIEDEIVNVGERYYVKSTAYLADGKGVISASAFAREAFDKKGMDDSQITGAASSYARKYALNGLFAIDDGKDADSKDNRRKEEPKEEEAKPRPKDCEHKNTKDFQKKDGKFKGQWFKGCVDCKKVIGRIDPPVEAKKSEEKSQEDKDLEDIASSI
jgi:hypothetical protein